MESKVDWKKLILVFLITSLIFVTVIYFSNYLSNKKIVQLKDTQDKIAIDILSSETRFALLKQSSCRDFEGDSLLSDELGELGRRLEFMESQLGTDNDDVEQLKKYYSILQIKDFILMGELSEKCKLKPQYVLYFYSNKSDCTDCEKQGYVLTALREKYPSLRVYSFDYNLDLSAIRTLIKIEKIDKILPALVIDGKVYSGFQSVEAIEKIQPSLKSLLPKTSATSTKK